MNALITRGLVGLGGISAAGTGGFLAWNQGLFSSKQESIRDRLKKEGYKVLDRNSENWGKIFNVYKGVNNTKKFDGEEVTESSIRDRCEKALSLESSKNDIYGKVVKWCVVPRKVEEVLSGITLLGIDENDTTDTQDWKPILGRYISTKTSQAEYAMKEVILHDPITGNTKEVENIKELKKGCKSRREKMTYELEFEKSIAEVKGWCSK